MKKEVDILFIGNSHTFFNDMPLMVRNLAEGDGFACRVAMLSHGGWYLEQHADQPDVRFDILFGGYDYVVLQEHAHPFGPIEKYHSAAVRLNEMIRQAGSKPVIYGVWSMKAEPEMQAVMNREHRAVAEEIGALLAPVGEHWWAYKESHPELELYWEDGAHASPDGSAFAAGQIWETIKADLAEEAMTD